MSRTTWEFFSPKNIIFGNGAIQKLTTCIDEYEAKNILIITDKGIVNAGILDKVIAVLHNRDLNIEIYDEAIPEPPIDSINEAYQFAKEKDVTDLIIALGGGSTIDLAKVVALLVEFGGEPADYFGEGKVPGPIAPLIAIPTTAGTGSEVTQVAVITDVDNNLKVGISDNNLRPTIALLDPELTIGLPPYITACSGIDALSHAIESYTAMDYKNINTDEDILFQGSYPLTDALAVKSIELIADNLITVVQQGHNLEARSNMLLASLLAGMSFSNAGNSLAHALAYPIGGKVASPHGEVTGLLLPYVVKYNENITKNKMNTIRALLNSDESENQSLDEMLLKLLEVIGLPTKLSQIGIKSEDIEGIAEKTLNIERLMRNNPRVADKKSLMTLLEEAL